MPKSPKDFREVAQIVINIKGNPMQIGVRYISMKEAQKQFDALDKLMRKPLTYSPKAPRDVVVLTGDSITFVGMRTSIEAWSLHSNDDYLRMTFASQDYQARAQIEHTKATPGQ